MVESEPATVTITIDSDGILVTTAEDGFVEDGLRFLREAIQAANTNEAVDGQPAGTEEEDRILFDLHQAIFELTALGANQDTNATGDLDIMGHVTIIGCGHADTVLDGKTNDRVFDVFDADVVIENLTVTSGVTSDFGGGIRNAGNLTLRGVNMANNQTIGVAGADGNMPGGGGGGGAAGFGGGIYNTTSGVLTAEAGELGCFFSENSAIGGIAAMAEATADPFTGLGGTGGGYYGGSGGNASNGIVGGFRQRRRRWWRKLQRHCGRQWRLCGRRRRWRSPNARR